MAPRLKVFSWSDGFHAFTVATTSRPKALEAWGSRQDLFASGLARELTEGPDHEAALASPGVIIERGEAIDPGAMSKVAPAGKPSPSQKARALKSSKIEARLEALDVAHGEAMERLDQQAAELETQRQSTVRAYERSRDKLVAERKALRRGD